MFKENSSTIFDTNFANIKLVDDSSNRQDWFGMVMSTLDDMNTNTCLCPMLIFGNKIEGVGGYFTPEGKVTPRIVMPESVATCGDDWVKFNDTKQFGIFVHECGHFFHYCIDNGKFTAPSLEQYKPVSFSQYDGFSGKTVDAEYEAGYRSMKWNLMYDLFPENDRTILDLNLVNMSNYLIVDNIKEIQKEKDFDYKKRYDDWMQNITKWSQISSYHITL